MPVNAAQVGDHGDVDARCGEQVGDGDRVRGHRHAFADAVVVNDPIGNPPAGRDDLACHPRIQFRSKQCGVQSRQRLALGFENPPQTAPER